MGLVRTCADGVLMMDSEQTTPASQSIPFFSYGFRPFFLSAALFAGLAVSAWILVLTGVVNFASTYSARDWHVHEMVFGFLPAVITGFLLTAIPNWTDRPPIHGRELAGLWGVWVAGRLLMAWAWFSPLVSSVVDGAFLAAVVGLVWREIATAKSWFHAPMGVLITVYAGANILFHVRALSGEETDMPERMALGLIMVLLALIGGRVTPNFTGEYLLQQGANQQPSPFSRFDGLAVVMVVLAAGAWTLQPQAKGTAFLFILAGTINMIRLSRWQGWLTWREPLVFVLHVGYGWLVLSLLVLGGAVFEIGLSAAHAVHALTTGAVGVMTLAVMTRASLGHTGRAKHAGPLTVSIYTLAFVGALFRVFGLTIGLPTTVMLGMAAVSWSSAYLLFAVCYGPFLLRPSLHES